MASAYEDWISIFSEDVARVWKEEQAEEIRKVSLLYYSFQKEIRKISSKLEQEFEEIKSNFKQKAGLSRVDTIVYQDLGPQGNKENIPSPDIRLQEIDLNNAIRDDMFAESPDVPCSGQRSYVFHMTSPKRVNQQAQPNPTSPSLLSKPASKIKRRDELTDMTFLNTSADVLDKSSIIAATPELKKPIKMKSFKLGRSQSKRSKMTKQSSTLTQMFREPLKVNKEKQVLDNSNFSMEIDEMLDFVNQENELNDLNDSNYDDTIPSTYIDDEPVQLKEIDSYHKIPEMEDSPEFKVKGPMRGKARKKLPGWTCKQCKDFYQGMDLSEDEIEKRMEECSKHRSDLPPRDETYKGFWDMTLGPTQKTLDSQKSIVFNFKKKI